MKHSQRALLTIIGAALFVTALAMSANAGPVTEAKNSSDSHRQRIMDPPSPFNERFSDVKSAGRNAGWEFAFGRERHPVVITGYADPTGVPTANPEPATLLLLATGLAGLGSIARSRRKSK